MHADLLGTPNRENTNNEINLNKFNYFKDKVSKNFKGLENIQKGAPQ